MIESLNVAYTNSRRVKLLALAGLICCGAILYWLSGGFPPWAWRFLLRVLPQTGQLLAAQGSVVLIPLIGLVLLSTALFIIWSVLILSAIKIGLHWWRDLHSRQHFEMELREAEKLAEESFVEQIIEPVGATFTNVGAMFTSPNRPAQAERMQSTVPVGAVAQQLRASRVVNGYNREQDGYATTYTMPVARQQSQVERQVRVPVVVKEPPPLERQETGIVRAQGTYETQQAGRSQRVQDASFQQKALSTRERLRIVRQDEYAVEEIPTRPDWTNSASYRRNIQDTRPGVDEEPAHDQHNTRDEELEAGWVQPLKDSPDLSSLRVDIDQQVTRPERESDGETQPYLEALEPEEPMRLVVSVGLDPGIARKQDPNEDSLLAIQGTRASEAGIVPVGLFVVADGMGGHANGQEASRIAVNAIGDVIVPAVLRGINVGSSTDEEEIFMDLLKDGVHRANLAIYKSNRETPDMMGTTLTAALIVNATAYIANVGDSRTYLYRISEGLRKITRDHSLVEQMVESGVISRDDVYTHPKRNQITRCLGERASVEMDAFVLPLQPDDILLLCSDGLWEMVKDADMEKIIASSSHHVAQISTMLVQAALGHGGADNVSVIVVGVVKTPA